MNVLTKRARQGGNPNLALTFLLTQINQKADIW